MASAARSRASWVESCSAIQSATEMAFHCAALGAFHGSSAPTCAAIWLSDRIVASISTSAAGLAGGMSPEYVDREPERQYTVSPSAYVSNVATPSSLASARTLSWPG